MYRLKSRKGFSLVELLAVIVILGLLATIGIVATTSLVDKAKKDKMDSQKNTVTMSAQTYMQNNKNLVPKIIGGSSIIQVSDLRAAKYLTEDIKNDKGESCMEKSYVKVYKLSNTEYTYTTFLYCGSEEVPQDEVVPLPVVSAKFSDSSGTIKDSNLNNVSDAYLYIEIGAAEEDEILSYKNAGTEIALDGYSFSLFVVRNGKKQEAYNSGSLSGGRKQKIVINKKIDDYIDVTGVTEVSIEVIAINTLGGITNANTTVGEHNDKLESTTYDDNVKPKCVKPDSPYEEGDWLNKNEYNLTKNQRKLTVGCDDGTGSGCIRNYFTMSWPNDDDKYGAEYVYIDVKDNAGNVSERNDECKFRVNVDIKTPEAKVTAYVGQYSASNETTALLNKVSGSNVLTKTISVNDSKTSASITTTDYSKLAANNTDVKWMNNANYPNGVIYKIELKDNIRLDKWTWNTNAGYINSTQSSDYLKVSNNNPEAQSGNIAQDAAHGATEFHGSTFDTVYVRFLTEGMRYGVFTVYDKSGNKVEIKIAANLDRTAPPVPDNLEAYVYNKVRTEGTSVSSTSYTFGSWINRYVQVRTVAGQDHDKLTNNTNLSGFWEFRYDARNNANTRVGSNPYKTYTSGKGIYDFKGSASQVDGKNKIRFMGCDKAGNCSEWGNYKEVWIDITVPVCTVTKSITNGAESDQLWLGIGETARVTATCNDPTSTLASGCTVGSFYHDYNYQINTQKAGADGNGKGGSFVDAAGNSVTCSADKRIQIDYEAPKCSVSGGSSAWTNNQRVVKGTCSDTGGSGCRGNISHTYNYDIKTTSGGAAGNGNGGYVYDRADNRVGCVANQTVKVDRTMPYVTANIPPKVYDIAEPGSITVTLTCHDDLSGLSSKFDKSYTVSHKSPIGEFGVAKCCIDNAGNEMCDRIGEYSARIYGRHPDCGVERYKSCRTSACGVESYKTCRTRGCGVASYKSCANSSCGWKTCPSGYQYYCSACASCCNAGGVCKSNSYKSCRSSSCGVESYKSCEHSQCGVKSYNKCRASACGVELYNKCWHYGANVG